MILTPQAVEAYKQLITEPKKHGLDFPSLSEVFEESEEATPKHILFEQYIDVIKKDVPKVIFYIIMDGLYPPAKAPNGDFGYRLKVVNTDKT